MAVPGAMSLFGVEWRGSKPCCRVTNKENWGKSTSFFSLKIASSTLQTIDVRSRRLNRFGSVVWGAFAAGVSPVIRDLGRLEERL